MSKVFLYSSFLVAVLAAMVLPAIGTGAFAAPAEAGSHDFAVEGEHIETCSCAPPCPCEMIGLEHGCQGVGAEAIASGNYQGQDLGGAKIAYALIPAGEKLRLYIDAKNPEQRKGAEAFARMAFRSMGKVDAVKDAKIDIQGEKGAYTVKVDEGRIMTFGTEPVLGGDGKTPVAHTNTNNPLLPTFYQGKNTGTTYKDGDESFTLDAGTNAYFDDHMKSAGNTQEPAAASTEKHDKK